MKTPESLGDCVWWERDSKGRRRNWRTVSGKAQLKLPLWRLSYFSNSAIKYITEVCDWDKQLNLVTFWVTGEKYAPVHLYILVLSSVTSRHGVARENAMFWVWIFILTDSRINYYTSFQSISVVHPLYCCSVGLPRLILCSFFHPCSFKEEKKWYNCFTKLLRRADLLSFINCFVDQTVLHAVGIPVNR